jgi:hypothetical protein
MAISVPRTIQDERAVASGSHRWFNANEERSSIDHFLSRMPIK